MKIGIILSQYIASKAVVDKIKIPSKHYNKVDSSFRDLESWVGVFKDFDSKKPHTWINSGLRLMRRISEPEEERVIRSSETIFKTLFQNGLIRLDNLNSAFFYSEIIKQNYKLSEQVIEGEQGELRRISLKEWGCSEDLYFYELTSTEDQDIEHIPFLPKPCVEGNESSENLKRKERREQFDQAISNMFWSGRKIVKIDVKNDLVVLTPSTGPSREYEGNLISLYETLPLYKEKGTRRSILFQGEPGTGKSTLVYNIAERLTDRALVMTHDFLTWVSESQWRYFLSVIRPEMIIVDDIDRIADYMARKLPLFEDHYCQVPLIIMTSNHYEKLTDAFRRPGRLDEIIEMQSPNTKIRYEVIRSLASQEEVDLPDYIMPILDKIHSELPGAYIVELLRRVKVLGWSYHIPTWDLTFRDMPQALRKEWNEKAALVQVQAQKEKEEEGKDD